MLNHIEETQSFEVQQSPFSKKRDFFVVQLLPGFDDDDDKWHLDKSTEMSKSRRRKKSAVTWQISDFKNEHFVSLFSKSEDAIYIFIYLFELQ